MMNAYRHERALYCKLMWKQSTSINQDAEMLSDDISLSHPIHTKHCVLTHPPPPTLSLLIFTNMYRPVVDISVCTWRWNNERSTLRVLEHSGGIIYTKVTSAATKDMPMCWALHKNPSRSHLDRIHLMTWMSTTATTAELTTVSIFHSQQRKIGTFWAQLSRPILDVEWKQRWIMPWTLSAALAQSMQTVREPWVTAAEISIYTADTNLMRRLTSAPIERLRKRRQLHGKQKRIVSELHFLTLNPRSLPGLMVSPRGFQSSATEGDTRWETCCGGMGCSHLAYPSTSVLELRFQSLAFPSSHSAPAGFHLYLLPTSTSGNYMYVAGKLCNDTAW